MEQPGRDDLIVEATSAQEGCDLERMQDELGPVDFAHLPCVELARPLERVTSQRPALHEGWIAAVDHAQSLLG